MSQLSSTANPGSQHQKQRINVYTMMLIVSFIAICLACVCMYLELEKYGQYPWWDTKNVAPSTAPAAGPTSSLRLKPDAQFAWSSPARNFESGGDFDSRARSSSSNSI